MPLCGPAVAAERHSMGGQEVVGRLNARALSTSYYFLSEICIHISDSRSSQPEATSPQMVPKRGLRDNWFSGGRDPASSEFRPRHQATTLPQLHGATGMNASPGRNLTLSRHTLHVACQVTVKPVTGWPSSSMNRAQKSVRRRR